MSDEGIFFLAAVLPMTIIIGGVVVIVMAMRQRSLTLEMKHRERMAMIERGVVPGPARDPAAFETWQRHHDQPPARSTSIGIVIVALGLGLMLMIGFAGDAPGPAIGIGGAIVVVGAAFIVNGELQRRSQPPAYVPRSYSAPPPAAGPPDPTGPPGP